MPATVPSSLHLMSYKAIHQSVKKIERGGKITCSPQTSIFYTSISQIPTLFTEEVKTQTPP